ncbi:hypothetical protein [Nitrospira sp. BLG_2]|uniref:hypothetical protein n=1 Tax=Nitrospira sp. BLG_2 TaxID=3397507 RepID=UPI003B9B70D6
MLKTWLKTKQSLYDEISALKRKINELAHENAALEKSSLGLKDAENYNYLLFKDAETRFTKAAEENQALKLKVEYLSEDIKALRGRREAA